MLIAEHCFLTTYMYINNWGRRGKVGGIMQHLLSLQLGGPIWSDPIHDPTFVAGLLEAVKASAQSYGTVDRIKGLLSVIAEVSVITVDICMHTFTCARGIVSDQ